MIVTVAQLRALVGSFGPVVAEWCDRVVPAAVPLLPHHPYSPAYAWMYAYEKQLKRKIEAALRRPVRALEPVLFGSDGVFSELLSNAFVHGHGRAVEREIEVLCSVARRGLALQVGDGGQGFDVHGAFARLQRGDDYFKQAGNGLRAIMEQPAVHAAYSEGGHRAHLAVPFSAAVPG